VVARGFLEQTFGAVYTDEPGQPPLPTRLMAGLAIQTARAVLASMGENGNSSVMRRLGGRCQRGIRRCLWTNGGQATTAQILEWAYPRGPGRDRRERKNRARAVSLASRKMAVVVGRVWPGGNVWKMNAELMERWR
jgi:hypothetical protein